MSNRCVLCWLAALAWTLAGAFAHAEETAQGPRILHLPPDQHLAEQGILTPIPIQLQVPEGVPASRVLVHYKLHGSEDWTTLALLRTEQGWQGAIPCLEVSTVTGDVKYYVRVHDADGRVVAYSGTRHSPYRIRIVHDTARSDATLEQPRCPDPSDCPAGLPGCPSEVVERIPCEADADCEGGLTCAWDGYCELDAREHTWLGLEVSQELGWVGTTGACSLASQENEGTLCRRRSDGAIYFGEPAYTNEPTELGVGNTRVWVGIQRLVSYDTSLRLRVGYAVLGEGPTAPGGVPFVPVTAELGVLHWFGSDPFRDAGWRPFVAVGAGYGMFDIETSAHVRADVTQFDPQGGNDLDQTVDLFKRAGDGFVSVGAGVLLASEAGWGLSGELSVAKTFPFDAIVVSPRLGVHRGF